MVVLKKDVKKLRAELRETERTVLAIENDLTNLLDVSNKASSMHTVVAAVQKLFRTHVKGEGDAAGRHGGSSRTGDEALSVAEVMQQKEYLQRACDVLKQQLSQAEAGSRKQKKKTMQENSMLIEECNMLRKEKSTFSGEIQVLQEKLKQARRNTKQLLARSKEAERSRTPASRSAKRSTASKGADMASSAGRGSLAATRPGLTIASASKTMPAFGVRSLSGGAGPEPSGREAEAVKVAALLEKQVRAQARPDLVPPAPLARARSHCRPRSPHPQQLVNEEEIKALKVQIHRLRYQLQITSAGNPGGAEPYTASPASAAPAAGVLPHVARHARSRKTPPIMGSTDRGNLQGWGGQDSQQAPAKYDTQMLTTKSMAPRSRR